MCPGVQERAYFCTDWGLPGPTLDCIVSYLSWCGVAESAGERGLENDIGREQGTPASSPGTEIISAQCCVLTLHFGSNNIHSTLCNVSDEQ